MDLDNCGLVAMLYYVQLFFLSAAFLAKPSIKEWVDVK